MSGGATTETTTAAPPAPRKRITDRARAERKLGWMLCAPAAFVMLAVTAYPIGYAIYLSLLRSDLRFPDETEFIGLSNYVTVLTSGLWWSDVWHTVLITVVSVAIELTLGMLLALVMHRAIFGRGAVRTAALIPYGIVTVVAAFILWKYGAQVMQRPWLRYSVAVLLGLSFFYLVVAFGLGAAVTKLKAA